MGGGAGAVAGGVGRSASFSMAMGPAGPRPGFAALLPINLNLANGGVGSGAAPMASAFAAHKRGADSPPTPTTPGPYDLPGAARKPVWEV